MRKKREVRHLKVPLAILAIGLAIILFALSGEGPQRLNLTIDVDESKESKSPIPLPQTPAQHVLQQNQLEDVAGTAMIAPRFIGEDSQKGKWEITARKAQQIREADGGERFELERVQAQIVNNRGVSVTFIAEEGNYNQAKQLLGLSQHVVVGGFGFVLETEGLLGNIGERTAWTTSPVSLTSQYGTLTANEMRVEGNGNHLSFKGDVKGHFQISNTEKEE